MDKDYETYLDRIGMVSLNDRVTVINYVKELFEIIVTQIITDKNKNINDKLQ